MTTTPNSSDPSSAGTILVTGARGKTGRRITERLSAGGHPVRAVGRESDPRFGWDEPETWDGALAPDADGRALSAVYLCYAPDAGFPGADATLGAFARAAAERGVRRLVLLTGRGEEGAVRSEQAVINAGVATVIVRAAFFAQGFTEDMLASALDTGVLRLPAGDVPEPFVDLDDLVDVAVAGLLGHLEPGVHELTGPTALTMSQVAAVLTEATGREVVYQPVTLPEFRADLLGLGLPPEAADGVAGLFAELFDGRNQQPTGGVRAALGRSPRSFADAMTLALRPGGAR